MTDHHILGAYPVRFGLEVAQHYLDHLHVGEAEFLKLAYDGSLATDPLQYIDNPEKLSFTVESYAQILGPFYLEMRQAR